MDRHRGDRGRQGWCTRSHGGPAVAVGLAARGVEAFAVHPGEIWTGLVRHLSEADLSWFVDNDVMKKLLALPGVGAVMCLIGIALILGAFTGVAAFAGGFMNWNFIMAGTGSTNPAATQKMSITGMRLSQAE